MSRWQRFSEHAFGGHCRLIIAWPSSRRGMLPVLGEEAPKVRSKHGNYIMKIKAKGIAITNGQGRCKECVNINVKKCRQCTATTSLANCAAAALLCHSSFLFFDGYSVAGQLNETIAAIHSKCYS